MTWKYYFAQSQTIAHYIFSDLSLNGFLVAFTISFLKDNIRLKGLCKCDIPLLPHAPSKAAINIVLQRKQKSKPTFCVCDMRDRYQLLFLPSAVAL